MRLNSMSRAVGAGVLVAILTAAMVPPTARAAGETLKIGIDLPVSGADAAIGVPTANGAVLAIEEANKKGLPGGY